MGKCKNCSYWKEENSNPDSLMDWGGECKSNKFVYAENLNRGEEPEPDMMKYWDWEGYSAGFSTGPEFGCIHFKEI